MSAVTPAGMATDVSPVQPWKALEPMLVTVAGIVKGVAPPLLKDVQFRKAWSPIAVRVAGSVTLERFAQLEKAAMLVT